MATLAKPFQLTLTDKQRQALKRARTSHVKAYVREKAAAILKVADGQSIRQVALSGLLRFRHPETVKDWISDYLSHGLAGLNVQAGRGRKAAFSPQASRRGGRPH